MLSSVPSRSGGVSPTMCAVTGPLISAALSASPSSFEIPIPGICGSTMSGSSGPGGYAPWFASRLG